MSSRGTARRFWYERAKHLKRGKKYMELADELFQRMKEGGDIYAYEMDKVRKYFCTLDQLEYNIISTGRRITMTRDMLHSDFANFAFGEERTNSFDPNAKAYDK